MKNLIFRKFYQNTSVFFLTSLFVMGIIVWTIQAVNYFDYVTEDGHGLKVYFLYTILNFPKIIHRILPFIFFISLFYIIISYKLKNELNIFWINGISKVNFANNLIIFSVILMFIQIFIGSYISPLSQFKARQYLKNSNIDFFTSLIKSGKFINIAKGLTIFIDKKNEDGSFSKIFIDDSTNLTSTKMIYAKNGYIISNEKQKIFLLLDGRVINNEASKINIFDFDEIEYNFDNLSSNTIVVPKIQEISTKALLSCFFNIKAKKFASFKCGDDVNKEIKQEILKRLYKPIYLPLITILCCFLLNNSMNTVNSTRQNNLVFLITFFALIISEASLRYSLLSKNLTIIYFLIPWILFFLVYFVFYKKVQNV
tara:strand:+ start:644 stop:1750 length:1107 start_codon:yes stop_codon:yes gene_type:complete